MEEDGLSDAIYGDLGDFEYGEMVKEKNEEIESLKDRLNQSFVTISELQKEIKSLKKENRQVNQDTSSLLLTARVELGRKQRNIASLQQKIDKVILRRPNNYSIADQTEPIVKIEPVVALQQETVDHLKDNRNDLKPFRIPKKNPFAKRENEDELLNEMDPCDTKKIDQPRQHLAKKNSYAKYLDVQEEKSKVSSFDREEVDGKRTRAKDRRHNRRHSPVTHTSSRQRDYKKFDSDDDNRHRRNDRKYLRDRSSNDENGRHSKRYRSDSTSNHHRSRTSTGTGEEKRPKTPRSKNPKNSYSKPRKDNRIDCAVKSRNDCVSDVKEKADVSKDSQQLVGLKENSLKECRKRKLSNDDDAADESTNHEQSEDPINSANEAIANAVIIEPKNITEVDTAETLVNPKNLNGLDVSRESLEVLPIPTNNSNQELPSVEAVDGAASIDNLNQFSPLREFSAPAEQLLESTDRQLETDDVPKTNQFQNIENSGSQMDIDHDLMKRTSGENQTDLSHEEKNGELLVESTTCPIVNDENNCESLPTQTNVSIMEESSTERQMLSKNSEYVVQDAGHEIRIFLTKKRKSNKISKVTS